MRTIKLCLLFLFTPFVSLGQGNCYNGQTEIFIEIWQIGGTGLGTYTFQIQNISGTEYFGPVQFSGAPNYSYYACLDYTTFPYTWFVETYDTSNPFNGTVDIYLDDSNGPLLFEGITGQTNQTFLLDPPIYGCTNPDAENYNSDADSDDGSCQILGCTQYDAFGYNPIANIDDGSCLPFNFGCIDNGTEISGSGEVNDFDGDGLPAFNYNPLANTDDGSCVTVVTGCMNNLACNYNSAGNTDDASCVFASDVSDCAYCSGETDGSGTIVNNDDDGDGICNDFEVEGCMDQNAINYNADATDDDGSCAYPDISGCMDPYACNYNSNANQDNNLCFFPDECGSCSGETDGSGTVIDNDLDNDGVCDADEISGCTDQDACDFNSDATDEDGSCTYPEVYYNCDGVCINDTNNNQICDENEISGCQDELACNFNENANVDDGSCYFAQQYYDCDGNCLSDVDNDGICDQLESVGCTDVSACNFNPFVTEEDGSCENTSCYGCIDVNACNYNATTIYPVENCIYASNVSDCASCSGETDGSGTILENDSDGDGVCNYDEIIGCTDDLACNYDANPTTDTDNSLCNYSTDLDDCATCSGETDGTGTIVDNDTDNDGVCNSNEIIGCNDVLACNYNPLSTDEGACNFALEYYDCDGNCLNDSDDNSICDEFQVDGCSDPDACNYNEDANVNDGSCEFAQEYYDCFGNCINDSDLNGICDELEVSGCTDSEACNYDANATMDNGTCEYLEVTLEYNNLSSSLEAISNASLATYQWNVNGENTNINSNRLNPFINGLYTVSVYDEENDCWGEASYTVNDVSINEVRSDIKIFPNPVHNTLHIKSKLNNQNTTIEVYNYLGKLLDAYQNKNSQYTQIDVSKLSSGIYIIKFKSEDFILQKEFIKY